MSQRQREELIDPSFFFTQKKSSTFQSDANVQEEQKTIWRAHSCTFSRNNPDHEVGKKTDKLQSKEKTHSSARGTDPAALPCSGSTG
jgi:hypothetical protein